MNIKLLANHLEFLSLKEDCTGVSESTHVKMPHCWKSHVAAHIQRERHSRMVMEIIMGFLSLVFFLQFSELSI